jgi:GT2 family glycosyltransferase
MPESRRLSVLIVSWNGREHLEVCLPSLLEQRSAVDCAVEILVLDNGSNDGTADWIARRHPEVRLVASERNLGFAGGNNRLAREADGDALLLINNDTRAEPDLLASYLDAWRSVPDDVAALAGVLTDWSGERLDFGRGVMTFDGHAFALDQGRELAAARLPDPGEELLFGCGGNLWISRRSFLDAGGFDESYFAYFEDVDLGWRLWAGGERVLACPAARARHRQSATGARLGHSRRGAMFERNALATVAKNLEDGLRDRLLPAVLLAYLSRLSAMADPWPPAAAADRRSAWAARLRRWAGRLAPATAAGIELPHPQAPAQVAGLGAFLATLDGIEAERARLAARRRRPDREIFDRFPLWVVPTYPGDQRLFSSATFRRWLPEDLELRFADLDEVIELA